MIILARMMMMVMIIRNCYRVFVTNIRSILLYAIVGTILNFLIIGGCLVLKEVEPFLDNFGLKLHMCFSVLLADGHCTNGDQCNNQCDNITGRDHSKDKICDLKFSDNITGRVHSKNQIGDFKLIFRFSFLQVSSLQLILWQCSPFLERSLSFLPFLCVCGGCLF